MDRRTLLALLLTAIVIVLTPMLFRAPPQQRTAPDTSRGSRGDTVRQPPPAPATPAPARQPTTAPAARTAPVVVARAETTVVQTQHSVFRIVSPGGTPANVELPAYHSLRRDLPRQTPVALVEAGDRLLRLTLVGDRDTIALDTVSFRASAPRRDATAIAQTFTSVNAAQPVTLTYRFPVDSFVAHLTGTVGAAPRPWRLFVTLPSRIRTEEADTLDDTRHLSVGYKPGSAEVKSVAFRQLDPGAAHVDSGTIRWISERNKYFVVAVVPEQRDTAFRTLVLRGGVRTSKEATQAQATAMLPLTSNSFALKVYAGPQSWAHLHTTAPDLENVNPYGGWLHGVVQPFATIVMRLLLWMRHTLNVGYGWVLVIFGVMVRLLLWPLNQNAMRSSMRLQRIQPELAEIQKKFRDNPERQREAMLKLYQAHGMSPFTPVLGCLPMFLPMPILFALYFVFQNTIELRGVSFMWLPDLSLKDPYYITPLFMGISMFVLSWIGMRGMPPSPQGKMMSYVMPVMFTVLFWNFASGLNLYYAVQNIAALPQQWLLARERTGKAAVEPSKGTTRVGVRS